MTQSENVQPDAPCRLHKIIKARTLITLSDPALDIINAAPGGNRRLASAVLGKDALDGARVAAATAPPATSAPTPEQQAAWDERHDGESFDGLA